jgi:hypothetical protein
MFAWRKSSLVLLVIISALLLATWARYRLIEPAHVTFFCDGGAQDVKCMIRSWIIQAFVHQRLGWVALVLALLAWPTRSNWIAAIALFIACAGLILYTTELCAPAALLALIVIVREGQTTAQANSMSNTP